MTIRSRNDKREAGQAFGGGVIIEGRIGEECPMASR